jgi:glucose/arabinose dehydrogenase
LGAHVASLGMSFIEKDVFPKEYQNSVFIAEHGSWNKTVPDGYRITRVELEGNLAVNYEVFAEGWLSGAERLGRPVDVLEMEDGSLLVSDDYANCIYRITYKK